MLVRGDGDDEEANEEPFCRAAQGSGGEVTQPQPATPGGRDRAQAGAGRGGGSGYPSAPPEQAPSIHGGLGTAWEPFETFHNQSSLF